MILLRVFVFAAALIAAQAHAQSPAEISFWESVRDSRNPVELQAYLDQYPDGAFVMLARARLATLQKPAAQPVPAKAYPSAGDTWSYRLTYPRLRGQWGQTAKPPAVHLVRADVVSDTEIVDQLTIDGGSPSATRHGKGSYVVTEGVSLFSPYLAVFERLGPGRRLPAVQHLEAACQSNYRCQARVRSVSSETISVPAGRFETVKVTLEQEWQPFTTFSTLGSAGADMTGGRTLTIWYSPAAKRAVKYSSRLVAGAIPPMDATYDLELVSYQLK